MHHELSVHPVENRLEVVSFPWVLTTVVRQQQQRAQNTTKTLLLGLVAFILVLVLVLVLMWVLSKCESSSDSHGLLLRSSPLQNGWSLGEYT